MATRQTESDIIYITQHYNTITNILPTWTQFSYVLDSIQPFLHLVS